MCKRLHSLKDDTGRVLRDVRRQENVADAAQRGRIEGEIACFDRLSQQKETRTLYVLLCPAQAISPPYLEGLGAVGLTL
ncbi:MAG: hypothetical protein AAGB05_06915 [Pseudomonadota bacterium]